MERDRTHIHICIYRERGRETSIAGGWLQAQQTIKTIKQE